MFATSSLKLSSQRGALEQVRFGLRFAIVASVALVLLTISSATSDAYPLNLAPGNEISRKHPVTVEIENPEEVLSVLDNLMQNILVGIDFSHSAPLVNEKSTGNKRGIDLGLSRGFSGSQAAKHLMGMSAASFANGPGRRRK